MANYPIDAHWRDSARPARFFIVDARAAFPLVLFLMHIAWWTFWTAVGAMILFTAIQRYGYTVPVFLRIFRSILAGPLKMARPWWKN